MKTINELRKMSTREIAFDAKIIIRQNNYFTAKKLLKNHILIANEKMAEFNKQLNKKLGLKKSPVKVVVITDFLRFK